MILIDFKFLSDDGAPCQFGNRASTPRQRYCRFSLATTPKQDHDPNSFFILLLIVTTIQTTLLLCAWLSFLLQRYVSTNDSRLQPEVCSKRKYMSDWRLKTRLKRTVIVSGCVDFLPMQTLSFGLNLGGRFIECKETLLRLS